MELLNTLYVTTPDAYLKLQGDTVIVQINKEKTLQAPLHHLGAIVCFGDIIITPALLGRCAKDGRSIIYLSREGYFMARIEGPVSGNILLRQAQFAITNEQTLVLDIARSCIAGKLKNSRNLLLRSARDSKDETDNKMLRHAALQIGHHIERLLVIKNLDDLRGVEGNAARIYFEALNYAVSSVKRNIFGMKGRSKRPPMDRINAMLSFLYSLLMNDCRSALESVGLDPQLGFLHAVRPGRAALALDLMEEFRAYIADRLTLTLINRAQINEHDFDERPGDSVYLNENGRKIVIAAYQKRKQEEIEHSLFSNKLPISLLPHMQARLLARVIRKDIDKYVAFIGRG